MSLSADEKRARLQKALEYGGNTHSVQNVIDMVKSGKAQFWENGDGAIVTELHVYPNVKAVHYWLISGALQDCLDMDRDIVSWAVGEHGCTEATAVGRKGWGRVSASLGWKPHMYTFHKSLV